MKSVQAEVAFPACCTLGEGSLWHAETGRLLWLDIYQNKVFFFDPASRSNLAYDVGANVGTVVPTLDGKLLVALRDSIAVLDPKTGSVRSVVTPEPPRPGIRFNDGKCDPEGRFWVGTMVEQGPPGLGALYLIDHDLGVEKKLTGLSISNGLVWRGQHFYHIDTPTHEIREFRYDAVSGGISEPRVVTSFVDGKGAPDGMCIDAEGMLWVALYGGGGVVRVDPTSGDKVFRVEVAASNATSCAFGGPELNELFITTARAGLDSEQLQAEPLAGSLFRVKLAYRGVQAPAFGRRFS